MANEKPVREQKSAAALRKRAEALLRTRPSDVPAIPTEDVQAVLHELNVHHIELEIQNEELRHAQAELAHSHDRYADLYEFAPVGYVTLDENGHVLEANLTAAAMLGIDREELVQTAFAGLVTRDFQDAYDLHRRAVFDNEQKQTVDLIVHKIDGGPLSLRLESIGFQIDGRRVCRTALIDISRQHAAEQALRQLNVNLDQSLVKRTEELTKSVEQVSLLQAAIAHLGEGVMITDGQLQRPGPRFVFVNKAFCEITGYSVEELIGNSPRLLQGERTDRKTIDHLKAKLSRGQAVTVELVNYRKDGTPYDAELFITPLLDSQGRCNHFVSIHRDISEQNKSRRLLRESNERMRAVLNTATDAIININGKGVITDVNPATETLFGYHQDELIGQNVNILMPQPYRDEHDAYLARFLETRQPHIIGVGREVMGKRKDGSTFPIDLAVSEVDHLDLFTGIIRDTSERKKLQREVVAVAEEEQRRIGQELHDSTQQELAGLGMMAQTLLDQLSVLAAPEASTATEPGQPAGQQRLRFHDSMTQCRHLAQRITEGIARVHQDVRSVSTGLVPISLDSEDLMGALRELAFRTDQIEGITCVFKCDRPIPVTDHLIATHLYRIAQEAIANALKHARPSHLLIALESDDGQLTLNIADDGIGFDALVAERTGVGLKTMRYRAGLINASLSVTPVESGGTLVSCTLFPEHRDEAS